MTSLIDVQRQHQQIELKKCQASEQRLCVKKVALFMSLKIRLFIVCSPAEDGSEKYLEDEDGSKDDRTG